MIRGNQQEPATLVDLIEQAAKGTGGLKFIGGLELGWPEVLDRARQTADKLRARGISAEDRVCLMLPNSIEYVDAFFGCVLIGALPIPVSPDYRGALLSRLLDLCRPELTLIDPASGIAVDELGHVATCTVADLAAPEPGTGRSANPVTTVSAANTPAVLMMTSGTTSGRSKLVVYSHAAALQFARATVKTMPYTADDVIYTCMPMVHGAALMCDLFGAMLSGAQIVVAPRFSVRNYWSHIVENGATTASTLGTATQLLVQAAEDPMAAQHGLRVLRRSGASAELTRQFEAKFGLPTTEMYGLTDVGLITGLPVGATRIDSCGVLFDEWEAELRDAAGQPVPDETPGVLHVRPRADGVMPLGYLESDPPFGSAIHDGWFETGDLLVRHSDGYYAFVGRAKDVIRRSGENIAPADVEFILSSHPAVNEVAVYAVPGALGEDEVMACVVTATDIDPEDLRAFCSARLPYFAVPRFYRRVPSLPRTSTHKVQVQALRQAGITADSVDTGSTSKSASRKVSR